ncbi:MAG: metal-dependent transcriptional regulator [Chloroflexi bacterium]|nr:metal-dependent transcriptional regulator [Chloroflexota bacterium]
MSTAALDYIETIYNLTVEGDTVVGARLAEKFGVTPASVSEMLQRLQRDGFLTTDRAHGPLLTAKGTAEAEANLRRHRLAERFLFEVLKMDWIAAHEEAHALQHAMTPAIEARMAAVLGNPPTCPHGNPIPGNAPHTLEFLRNHQALRLSAAPVDIPFSVLCISEVVEDETALLRYVGEKGIRPGISILVRDHGPDGNGPLTVEVAGKSVALGVAVADKVWVYRQDTSPATGAAPAAAFSQPVSGN